MMERFVVLGKVSRRLTSDSGSSHWVLEDRSTCRTVDARKGARSAVIVSIKATVRFGVSSLRVLYSNGSNLVKKNSLMCKESSVSRNLPKVNAMSNAQKCRDSGGGPGRAFEYKPFEFQRESPCRAHGDHGGESEGEKWHELSRITKVTAPLHHDHSVPFNPEPKMYTAHAPQRMN